MLKSMTTDVATADNVLTLTKHTRQDQALQQYAYDPQVIDKAVMLGDMRKMDEQTRLAFYRAVCLSVGLNPLTQPFTIMERQDKTTWLYANSSATQQLGKLHQVSFREMKREQLLILGEPFYSAQVVAYTPDGRSVPSQSMVSLTKKKKVEKGKWPSGDPKFVDALDADGEPLLTPLRGEALANAIMKADTKALRRATLALVGLGWMQSDYEGKAVTLNMQTGEILEDARLLPPSRLLDAPAEKAKGLQQHIGDLYGDAPPAPLHPIWATIAGWYADAGQPEKYAEFEVWACKRYRVTSITAIGEADLEELGQKMYATLEPLIVARQSAQDATQTSQDRSQSMIAPHDDIPDVGDDGTASWVDPGRNLMDEEEQAERDAMREEGA